MENHDEIMRAIGRIEGKIDGINQRLDTQNGSIKDATKRIGLLEIDYSYAKGKVAAIATLISVIMTLGIEFIRKKVLGF